MATKKPWHPNFMDYMEMIVNHPNYIGLPIVRKPDGRLSWIATANSDVGKKRIEWAENKAKDLGIPLGYGVFAEVMRAIHPTKYHVCQICGSEMSINYIYPSVYFRKAIEKEFNISASLGEPIDDLWDELIALGFEESSIISFFGKKFTLPAGANMTKHQILSICEFESRKKGGGLLGPGVFSNFPDRFDGFHSYNLCCRASQDKGRSKENMKSYGKDRRAYEYWSDGNIHAANSFMNSEYFAGTSADHIGPLSLGFVHDPHYLRRMSGRDNSIKRDRLEAKDVKEIYSVEESTGVYSMTWYSALIWEKIKSDCDVNAQLVGTIYRDLLKQNVANFMYILNCILENAPVNGEEFLSEKFIEPKYEDFTRSYEFDELGNITSERPRHVTERSRYEIDRFRRIALESVKDYDNKSESESRRNISGYLNVAEQDELLTICQKIEMGADSFESAFINLRQLMVSIQERLLKQLNL